MKAIYTRTLTPLILLVLVTILAVSGAAVIPSAGQRAVPPEPVTPPQTLDDLFAAVARQVPEFGGMFYGPEEQTLQIYLTGITPQKVAGVQRAVVAVFGAGVIPAGGIKALKGQYGFLQLREWYQQMTKSIFGIRGVTLTDIDEAKNRLRIGVEKTDIEARVLEQLDKLRIPREAVVIEVTGSIVPLTHTVQSTVSQRQGGYQIGTSASLCTLGFNAFRGGVGGFVTNSHCTQAPWSFDGVTFGQASFGNPVGKEALDPQGFPCPSQYPVGSTCRYSDSAFVKYDATISWQLGSIARPTGITTNWLNPIPLTVDHNVGSPLGPGTFAIAGPPSKPYLVGLKLDKVGRTTGWTKGGISSTCVDFQWPPLPNSEILCQYIATNTTAGANGIVSAGDSGSPVFRNRTFSCVELYGILWGRVFGSHQQLVFSPIGGVPFQQTGVQSPQDLGPLNYATSASGCGCVQPPTGLVDWWPLDETSGAPVANVVSPHPHPDPHDGRSHPTPIGAGGPTSVAGMVAYALNFNGSSTYVDVPDSSGSLGFGNPGQEFSIDAWIMVNPLDKSGVLPIVDKRLLQVVGGQNVLRGYAFFLYYGQPGFQLGDAASSNLYCDLGPPTPNIACTNYISPVDVANGLWRHIAVTVERTGMQPRVRIYVDAGLVFTGVTRTGNINNNAPLLIGGGYPIVTPKSFFKGKIDEVEIFNRALTQPEIQSIFNAGSAGKCR